MFPRALTIARVRGVEVRVDPSWIVVLVLVVWSFQRHFAPAHDGGVSLVMAVVAALGFFGSVLAHELGHALEGVHHDVEVRGITLFLFGGVTEMYLEPERPRDEFVIAAVGPWVSLVAAAAFGLLATFVWTFPGSRAVADVAGLLGWLNLALAIFNLVPGAPLDGGRVLRAALWALTGDRLRAIRWSSRAGQVVAAGLVGLAVVEATSPSGSLVSGLWFGFIGWYLWRTALAELRQAEVRALIGDRTVAALLVDPPPRLPADQPLSLVADRIAASTGVEVFPVVRQADDPAIVASLHLEDVLEMDPTDRNFRQVRDVCRPIDDQPAVTVDTGVVDAVRRLHGARLLRVVDDRGEVVALLGERRIAAALERWHALARQRHRHLGPHGEGPGAARTTDLDALPPPVPPEGEGATAEELGGEREHRP